MELTLGGTSTEVLGNEVTPNPSINRTSIGRQRDALYNSCIGERRGTQASAGAFYLCLLSCCRSFRERKRRGAACADSRDEGGRNLACRVPGSGSLGARR